jgi:hypothetical protein
MIHIFLVICNSYPFPSFSLEVSDARTDIIPRPDPTFLSSELLNPVKFNEIQKILRIHLEEQILVNWKSFNSPLKIYFRIIISFCQELEINLDIPVYSSDQRINLIGKPVTGFNYPDHLHIELTKGMWVATSRSEKSWHSSLVSHSSLSKLMEEHFDVIVSSLSFLKKILSVIVSELDSFLSTDVNECNYSSNKRSNRCTGSQISPYRDRVHQQSVSAKVQKAA